MCSGVLGHNSENSDETVGESSIKVGLVLGPHEGGATNWGIGSALSVEFLVSFVSVDESFVREIVDLDSAFSSNDEPEELGGEEDNVHGGLGVDFFEMSSFDQVPDIDLSVFTTGGDEVGVGARSRVLIWALCPMKVCLRAMTELSQTLMVLSHEADTTIGFLTSWKYLTQETQS